MFRAFPKKKGRTFKYKGYTERLWRRLYKAERYYHRNRKKSVARVLVNQMKYADEDELEILEAKMLSAESPKNFVGYLD